MTLKNDIELANTRSKLRGLEEHYQARQQETPDDPHIQELTLHSLKRLINQLTEEIVRFEAHATVRQ